MQAAVREIYVDSSVADYIVRLVNNTRNHPDVYLGASPRGSIALYRAGQALAGLLGRDYVIPDDIKALAHPVLEHRMGLRPEAQMRGESLPEAIDELMTRLRVPGTTSRIAT